MSGAAQLLPLEGMVAQRHACATTTNGRDVHFTLDFRRDRQPIDRLRVPSKVEGDVCPTTILDHGRATTHSHLATSQSQSLTWLSSYHQPAGLSLNLTCRSFGTSSAWPLEIPSAGPVAGAGIPAGDCHSELDRRPACLVADHLSNYFRRETSNRAHLGTAAIPLPRSVGAPFRARPVDVNHRGSRPEGRSYGGSTKMRPLQPEVWIA